MRVEVNTNLIKFPPVAIRPGEYDLVFELITTNNGQFVHVTIPKDIKSLMDIKFNPRLMFRKKLPLRNKFNYLHDITKVEKILVMENVSLKTIKDLLEYYLDKKEEKTQT